MIFISVFGEPDLLRESGEILEPEHNIEKFQEIQNVFVTCAHWSFQYTNTSLFFCGKFSITQKKTLLPFPYEKPHENPHKTT